VAELENLTGSLDCESSPADRSARLALEAGLRLYRLLSEWAEWAAGRVEAGVLDDSGPRE
jgi:hypothetical protein